MYEPKYEAQYMELLESYCEKKGLRLQHRFPIRKKYIAEQRYSKKLGQVFDSFKYKIKKELQEKQKDLK